MCIYGGSDVSVRSGCLVLLKERKVRERIQEEEGRER